MIKIYCEHGSMTRFVKELGKRDDIKLLLFPFEKRNRKIVSTEKPSMLTWDSTLISFDSGIKWSNTSASHFI